MWTYRIIKTEFGFGIHEIYDGVDSQVSWTEDSVAPYGITLDQLHEDLHMMLEALDKPVLEEVDDKLVESEEE